jgi:hypothetical protein
MRPIKRSLKFVFIGADGLRGGWRFVAFLAAFIFLEAVAFKLLAALTHNQDFEAFTAPDVLIAEGVDIIVVLAVSYALARLERRGLEWFGFPLRFAFGTDFWTGTLFGGGMVSILFLAVFLSKGAAIQGLTMHGMAFVGWLALWIAAMMLVGISEELQFRGYPLAALTSGIGFWPAAIVLALIFGALHYFGKPMETVADGLSVSILGLFTCFTVRRTGTLWFAIGFHAAFDFFALAFYGSPNTGNQGLPLENHLLDVTFAGPLWLTGGPQGLEASWLMFPLLVAAFFALHRMYPEKRFPKQPGGPSKAR